LDSKVLSQYLWWNYSGKSACGSTVSLCFCLFSACNFSFFYCFFTDTCWL